MTAHRPDRWGTICTGDGEPWPCATAARLIATGGMTWHVQPAASTREPYLAPPRPCPVCSEELPAGYGRHPTCDPRWLQEPASGATGVAGHANTCAVGLEGGAPESGNSHEAPKPHHPPRDSEV